MTIHTYHCICTQLVLASTSTLESLKTRTSDSSHILPLPDLSSTSSTSHYASLANTTTDAKPTVIRCEDGFEKRYFHKCGRCELSVAYSLDKSQFEDTKTSSGPREDVVFLIPGGLMSTQNMKSGKDMDAEITKISVKAA
ncbi:uncharacterized protein M437DRAFT_55699 [Aureobasidium melanogenum CBS 110374]|uniref:STEEP1 domain-containing protein n=1 Tax=Aureobasidium melanogenum (strain CBS 110374) TaxID=1043003 RepID=A0A074VLM8_AURM1|nr:uncharacterized protein M437DRAFT_55699 [Aureobasidium melanogenum CBS 110374]KEQ60034.1 hypothetical protein M437DRAFT_55699 [Aureobasidium melanogenum CBS 110374]